MKFLKSIGYGVFVGVMLIVWTPIVLVLFIIASPFIVSMWLYERTTLKFKRKHGNIAPHVEPLTLPKDLKLKDLSKFYADLFASRVPDTKVWQRKDKLVYFVSRKTTAGHNTCVMIDYVEHETDAYLAAYEDGPPPEDESENEIHESLSVPDPTESDTLSFLLMVALLQNQFTVQQLKNGKHVLWIHLTEQNIWYKSSVQKPGKNRPLLSGAPSRLRWYKEPAITIEK
jgi:hypothetical protein